jgi:hypothetical protein
MSSLKEIDKLYIESISATYHQLERAHQQVQDRYIFDLTKSEISEAIIERLKAYYLTQENIKRFLDKRYVAAASDFFVESILFFLRLYLQSQGGQLQAHSEKQIMKTKNSIRPDISIWKQNEVVAIIECKTQLGWNRDNWEQLYNDRGIKLKKDFPNAQSFLLVMTGLNWGGFGTHVNLNDKFFCLLNDIWPTQYVASEQIMTPIEKLFSQLN